MEPLQLIPQQEPTIWEQNPKLKMLLLILIGVFLLSGIGLVIFQQWSTSYRQKVYEETQSGLPTHQVKSATTTSESQTDTSNWKTYKNDQYDFELKFPPSWSGVQVEKDGLSFDLFSNAFHANSFVCGIKVYTNPQWQQTQSDPHSDVLIAENKGNIFTYECDAEDYNLKGFESYTKCAYSTNKDQDCQNSGNGPKYEFENLIISTFKFTDQSDTTTWKTYKNDKYGFELQYPSYFQVGEQSKNSVLGTATTDVPGIYIGYFVFVPLITPDLKQTGDDYFNGYYNQAINPSPSVEGPGINCQEIEIPNTETNVKLVKCMGEGGLAYDGLIKGNDLDIFIDGYSGKGTFLAGFQSDADLIKSLSSFKFTN